jgi:hypothetical protein
VCSVPAALVRVQPAAAVGGRQAQFHLSFDHKLPFLFRINLAEGVGQRLSKGQKCLEKFRDAEAATSRPPPRHETMPQLVAARDDRPLGELFSAKPHCSPV